MTLKYFIKQAEIRTDAGSQSQITRTGAADQTGEEQLATAGETIYTTTFDVFCGMKLG